METRRMALLFAVTAIMAISLFAAGCTQGGSNVSAGQGRVVFTVADAAADMGAVTSVKVTVDSLQVQNASGGWITVSSTPYTYDLMQLRASGSQALLADAGLAAGAYGQVRMHISKVMITDSTGEHEATLPSSDLRIVGGFEAKQNSTTAVTFDFLADKSVHVTGNGKYILAPVVRMLGYEGVEVDARSRGDVKVTGGRVRTDIEVGMDSRGNMGAGMGMPANANITIDGGAIVVRGLGEASNQGQSPSGNGAGQGNGNIFSINVTGQAGMADLTACIAISSQPERMSCIAQWCGSENRDYNQCYALTDENDKLGCLNKCNPNSNI